LYPTFDVRKKFQDRTWRHVTLLIATFISTTMVGADHYAAYLADYTRPAVSLGAVPLLTGGLWYSGTILIILGAHELGHYIACRYYQVDASLPFFIPMPLVLTGTLGAFIRIREPIPTKRALFDIGSAGPFAGFVFAVPALFIGLAMSHVAKLPPNFVGFNLGEPLLFKIASHLIWGPIPDGYSINLHPMAFAAWFGMLATALNLFPIGQLDGGHITYAVLGRRSSAITIGAICTAVGLTYFSSSWIVWSLMMLAMTLTMGPHHPRTIDEDVPLDRTRLLLAAAAAIIWVLCFTYAPIEPTELLK
jgi:membrane-associated protease RseP (regulator of RpoE activity)